MTKQYSNLILYIYNVYFQEVTKDIIQKDGILKEKEEDELDFLSKIIKVLNDTFGLDLTSEDKVEFNRMKDSLYTNEELISYFNPNNSKDNIQDKFNEVVDDELLNFIDKKLEFYNKMTDDKVNLLFKRMWFNEMYDRHVRGM